MAKKERRVLRSETVDLLDKTGKTVSVDIPRDKFIRRIYLRQHGDMDLDDITSAPIPSPVPSVIDHIRLIRDGSEVIISADPSYLMAMDYLEHGGQINQKIPHMKTGDNQEWHSTLILDFMVDPKNEAEVFNVDVDNGGIFTVMLPAMDYSSFKLEIDVDSGLSAGGSGAGMEGLYDVQPTTHTGFTADLDITLEEFFMEQGDPILTRDDVYELRTIQTQKATATASAVDHPYELTTGVLMRRLALFQYDASKTTIYPHRPIAGAPLVDRFKLRQTSPISWTIIDEDFGSLQAQDISEYNVSTLEKRAVAAGYVFPDDRDVGVMAGFTVLDFDDGRNLEGALDLTGMKSGDIKLLMRLTADATTGDYMEVIEQYLI